MKDNPEYKTVELAEKLAVSRKTVSVKLKKLREKGIIERIGSDRKGYWNIYL
ncbi:MAG: winged helix-turn-helix domain-containing protein [bacterium]|nr:winged helix-turn-helix domain-containing protein [bacterium]